ncbi:MAG: metallophosphoesterase [Candidatus Sumerlaeaceae bacterium]|nr:metallophosphoesterase [Candidatus Sumerlaeaceae bacterium]
MPQNVNRRQILKFTGGIAAGAIAGGLLQPVMTGAAPINPNRKRVGRVAHLTDIHVEPELRADKGLAACLKAARELKDKPDLVLNGGDAIMDSLKATRERTQVQWDLLMRVFRDECPIPIEHCIGNHDIWGWGGGKTDGSEADFLYGKEWAQDVLLMEKPYRSFDRFGWHFVVLDSIQYRPGGGYIARIDDGQMEWLQADLEATPATMPVLVLSHVPILNAGALIGGNNPVDGKQYIVSGAAMILDARKLKNLFYKHPNVKLCLSGHIHLLDQIRYNGVTYICSGAVCGNWWKGILQETPEGFGVIDLYDDGSHDFQYVAYGWKAGA